MFKNHIVILVVIFSGLLSAQNSLTELTDFIEKELKFEQNNFEILKSDQFVQLKERLVGNNIYNYFPAYIGDIRAILKDIKQYDITKARPNKILSKLFNFRRTQNDLIVLDYIDNIKFSLTTTEIDSSSYWGINESIVEKLKRNTESPIAQWNHIISRTSLDRFQLLGSLIKALLLDMKENGFALTEENSLWLRCSVSLHPFLKGKIEYLEKPEQVQGYNRDTQNEPFENELYRYYTVPVPKQEFTFEYKNLGCKDQKTVARQYTTVLTQYEFDRLNGKKHKSLKLPEFQFPKDLALFSKEPSNIENLTNNQQKIENSSNDQEMFLHAIDKNISELGDETATAGVQENIQLPDATVISENVDLPKNGDFAFEMEPLNNDTLDLAKEVVIHKGESDINFDFSNDFLEENFISEKEIHARYQKKKKEKLNKITEKSLTNFTITKNYSNNQVDHINLLNKNQIIWLKQLLHGELKTCKYRKFKAIWLKLNGPKSIVPSKSGSSHFSLLNRNQDIIGGIFSHGDNQEYWGSSVQDLISHFKAIGIDENALGSLL